MHALEIIILDARIIWSSDHKGVFLCQSITNSRPLLSVDAPNKFANFVCMKLYNVFYYWSILMGLLWLIRFVLVTVSGYTWCLLNFSARVVLLWAFIQINVVRFVLNICSEEIISNAFNEAIVLYLTSAATFLIRHLTILWPFNKTTTKSRINLSGYCPWRSINIS